MYWGDTSEAMERDWEESNRRSQEAKEFIEKNPKVVDDYIKKHPGILLKHIMNNQAEALLEYHKAHAKENSLSGFISMALGDDNSFQKELLRKCREEIHNLELTNSEENKARWTELKKAEKYMEDHIGTT